MITVLCALFFFARWRLSGKNRVPAGALAMGYRSGYWRLVPPVVFGIAFGNPVFRRARFAFTPQLHVDYFRHLLAVTLALCPTVW